ncbi:transporter substrate-binding domain-containing protein [Rheinheimera sp.]|uniref:substrate-binding periplasmic protein n=1 Tax=Rheinheimera sp. TaxID=1869214 RepID=UPI00307F88C6
MSSGVVAFCAAVVFLCSPVFADSSPCSLAVPVTEQPHQSTTTEPSRWFALQQELLQLLAESADCSIQLIKVPWARGLLMLQEGELDLVMTLSKTPERERYTDFIGSHYLEEMILVLRREHQQQVQTLNDLLQLPGKIAVLRDGFYGEAYQQLRRNPAFERKLQAAQTISHQLAFLQHQRVLGIIGEKTQYEQWARSHPEQAADYVEHLVVNRNPVYFAASRKALSQQQRDHLRQSWAKVYGSAKHKAILQKYGWNTVLQ